MIYPVYWHFNRCTPTYKSVYANLHIGVRQLKVGIMGLFY